MTVLEFLGLVVAVACIVAAAHQPRPTTLDALRSVPLRRANRRR